MGDQGAGSIAGVLPHCPPLSPRGLEDTQICAEENLGLRAITLRAAWSGTPCHMVLDEQVLIDSLIDNLVCLMALINSTPILSDPQTSSCSRRGWRGSHALVYYHCFKVYACASGFHLSFIYNDSVLIIEMRIQ